MKRSIPFRLDSIRESVGQSVLSPSMVISSGVVAVTIEQKEEAIKIAQSIIAFVRMR